MGADPWRLGMLTLPTVCATRWAARYDVETFSGPCSKCGTQLSTTLPFAWGPWRGLTAPRCPCGNTDTPFCVSWQTVTSAPESPPTPSPAGRRRRPGRVLKLRRPTP